MVLQFFRRGDSGMDHIERRTISMLGDARHSFDLATDALLTGVAADSVSEDIWATDRRINETEQELRRELVVHVSVQGSADIGQVLSYTLLLKKIERIGDQAKNILDLAQEGVDFVGADDLGELVKIRREVSDLFRIVGEQLASPDDATQASVWKKVDVLRQQCEANVREYLHAEVAARHAVPRAIFYRYMKRIVANLGGIMSSVNEPVGTQGYRDGGETDIDDD